MRNIGRRNVYFNWEIKFTKQNIPTKGEWFGCSCLEHRQQSDAISAKHAKHESSVSFRGLSNFWTNSYIIKVFQLFDYDCNEPAELS